MCRRFRPQVRAGPCVGSVMIYILAIFTGLAGALGGWATGVVAATAAGIGTGTGDATASAIIGSLAAAAGFLTAVALTLYTKGGFRTPRDLAIRSVGVVLMTGLLVAGGVNLRAVALTHLGLIARAPAVEFEIRLPPAAANADVKSEAQVELLTDHNQTLAQLDDDLRATQDGRAVLHGRVPLRFRTSERIVVLSLRGQAQRTFKLRLPANPSPSDNFSPWHMVDQGETASRQQPARQTPDDNFAIRYRVL